MLSGGGGAGKTTIAQTIGALLTTRRHPTAVLDLEAALAQAATHEPIQDFTVVNDRAPAEVAAEVLVTVGWRE